jgi:hypothetical protein
VALENELVAYILPVNIHIFVLLVLCGVDMEGLIEKKNYFWLSGYIDPKKSDSEKKTKLGRLVFGLRTFKIRK